MRFRQPAILHGLPHGLAISGDTPKREYPEHLSQDLLKEFARIGRSLEEVYGEHVKQCRDCHDFFMEFCSGEKRGEKRLSKAQ